MAIDPRKIRCLFLASSGVRVRHKELRELGVTLPGFLERGKVIASLPSLGLLTLAAHSPSHWELEYRETGEISSAEVIAKRPDVVAISTLSAQVEDAYDIADQLRRAGIYVIMGGLHVSTLFAEALEHSDTVVVGEGEIAWEKFCADFEAGAPKRLYRASDYGFFDFKNARTPRYDLLDMNRYNRITVQTQRGCPRQCHFCSSSHTISNYKCKPVEQVVREIEEISKFWPHPFIELADDNTFIHKKWAKDLMRALIPLGIRWFTETDISVAEDDELLELISQAGCYQILIGLESTNASALSEVDPMGWKARQGKKYQDAIRKIQGHGISVNGCFILGWDHDTQDVFENTRRAIEDLELSEVQITVLTPFPNTVLYQTFKKDNRLIKEKFWSNCTLFDVNFRPKLMTVEQLERGLQSLFGEVYNASATAKRRQVFRDCVKNKHRLKTKVRRQVLPFRPAVPATATS